jgi:23S rRNA (cytidine2498-2'-O)-methyltransferase
MEPLPTASLPSTPLFLFEDGCAEPLRHELQALGARILEESDGWLLTDLVLSATARPLVAFARQCLPHAEKVAESSINAWARRIADSAIQYLPTGQPWRLCIAPLYGQGQAGQQRCKLILAAVREVLQKKRRTLLRGLEDSSLPFEENASMVQLILTTPEQGFLSVAPAPLPWAQRQILWPQPGGQVPVAQDKAAPSRAFAKLVEAEIRMGQRILPGHTVVDLGAAPGSWTYVAVNRGARVTAIDRSPLREDLMEGRNLTFIQGDAFRFRPERPVDWLICDIIAEPVKLSELLLDWLREGHCQRFVFTIKFKGDGSYHELDLLRRELPALCESAYLSRLCANKNEVTAFGVAKRRPREEG